MKALAVLGLMLETFGLAITSTWQHFRSPLRIVCAQCKKELGGNKKSTSISHGLCSFCFYKTLRPTLLVVLAVLSLGLSACQHKARFTEVRDEKAYCNEHPSECAVRALSPEVRP